MARSVPIEWELDVPVATHPLMLAGFVKVCVISTALMGALLALLMAVNGSARQILPMLGVTALIGFGLLLLMLVVALLFFRNRMRMQFSVKAAGATTALVDRRAEAASK